MDPVVAAAVAEGHRGEWGRVVAAAARLTGDLDAAEDCAQDAYASALSVWAEHGVPERPGAWLTTVARRRAMDLIRSRDTLRAKLPLLADPGPVAPAAGEAGSGEVIPDDRLQLIFTCCHPALAVDARVALTLRLLCGLTTAEVAHAFLTGEATMAARITRAKKKITAARIPYRIPGPDQLPDRLAAVLDVVHLVFATGHTAPAGPALQRRDLAERALDLARMLRLPGDPGVAGLLALILLTDARRHARTGPDGRLLVLAGQDRDAWDHGEISEGLALARQALAHRPYTRYPLMAAIAATHATAARFEATDWAQILALYDQLIAIWPSPIVALNRAIALGEARGPAAALAAIDALAAEPQLTGYHYLPAARAEYLRQLHRTDEARLAYDEALVLAGNTTERDHLTARRASLDA